MKRKNRTLAIIKPDAYEFRNEILSFIDNFYGFDIIQKKSIKMTRTLAEEFYKEHKGKDFFERLVEFMTSGKCLCIEFEYANNDFDMVSMWRELMGPTDPTKRKPGQLRFAYGSNDTQVMHKNAVHGSDSHESAEREINLIFGMEG